MFAYSIQVKVFCKVSLIFNETSHKLSSPHHCLNLSLLYVSLKLEIVRLFVRPSTDRNIRIPTNFLVYQTIMIVVSVRA